MTFSLAVLSSSRNARSILCVVGWNLLFILAGFLLIVAVGEAYFRLNGRFGNVWIEFSQDLAYWRFVPGVGLLRPPQSEFIFSNGVDVWTVQRTNSLGFLNRELIDPERAAVSCHITIIGDSFVEAREVPVYNKLQVRLEEVAAYEAPHLDVTTSAFGIQHSGQLNQLAFYDGYARHLGPDLVVLLFTGNDLGDNSTERYALMPGYVPEHLPYGHAVRDGEGKIIWLPPGINFSVPSSHKVSWSVRVINRLARASYFMRWLGIRTKMLGPNDNVYSWLSTPADSLTQYREYMRLLEDEITGNDDVQLMIQRDAWGFTSLGLEQFKRRADHDGAVLMVLAVYDSEGKGSPRFDRLSTIADSLGIPVVSQYDYIIRQGYDIEDAYWGFDYHWTPAGHQWAADAIWEYIEEEWEGKCPELKPQPDKKVDWVVVGDALGEVEYEDRIRVFEEPLGLWNRFHTPEGETSVNSFPVFDIEGYESAYSSVVSGSPVARSDWIVYVYGNGLTYVKEPCVKEDVASRFFLHVTLADDEDNSAGREQYGFENLGFYFYTSGERFKGKCIVSTDLPEYEVASIRTGQIADGVELWSAYYNFNFPEIVDAMQEIRRSGREPVIRSNFNVYIDDGLLVYVKESCDADDRDLPFFLHVFPADDKDLPAGRDEYGFNNLGFELMQRGGMHDDGCFAAVDLPGYEISSIRTGQWVRGEGEVWEASIEFGE